MGRDLRTFLELPDARPMEDRVWRAIAERVTPSRRVRSGWLLGLGLVGACAVGLLVVGRVAGPPAAPSPAEVALGDGARALIEAASTVRLTNASPEGTIVALEGSASFDVAPRGGRRFTVNAGAVRVTVQGTRFDVRRGPGHSVSILVHEGMAEVESPRGRLVLGAGETLTTSDAPAPTSATAAIEPPTPSAPAPVRAKATTPRADSPPRSDANGLFAEAVRAHGEGRHADAERAFLAVETRFPRDPLAALAAYQRGRLALDGRRDTSAAIRAFEAALRARPNVTFRQEIEAALVEAWDASGDRTRCRKARAAFLARHPEAPYARAVSRACGGDDR